MTIEDTELMNDLIDLYGNLLTPNQLEIMEYYYMNDLSLSEIGENLNITRSAVHDTIKKSSKILLDYEEKLKLLKKEKKKQILLEKIEKLDIEEIKKEIENL